MTSNKTKWIELKGDACNFYDSISWKSTRTRSKKHVRLQEFKCYIENCDFKVKLEYGFGSNLTRIYKNKEEPHLCEPNQDKEKQRNALSEIKECTDKGIRDPMEISRRLEIKVGPGNYMKKQIYNYIYRKLPSLNSFNLCVSDIKDRINEIKLQNEEYIYDINAIPLIITFTSESALNKIGKLFFYHMDHTYKCTYPDFPVLVVGASDAQRQFHLLSISICSNQDTESVSYVLNFIRKQCISRKIPFNIQTCTTDAAHAFKRALTKLDPSILWLNCYTHISRSNTTKASAIRSRHRAAILYDIFYMQLSPTTALFEAYLNFFMRNGDPNLR